MQFGIKSDTKALSKMEEFFAPFRRQVVQEVFHTDGNRMVYADWTASGRLYRPIEEKILDDIGPFVANTHTETSFMGSVMTHAYHEARKIIKNHVGASDKDVLICCGSGMTGAINKLQRILGLKIHEKYKDQIEFSQEEKPLIIVSHMEHHSNQTSWLETVAEVVVLAPDSDGLFCFEHLEAILEKYQERKVKIAAITSCSNVTGIFNPYHEVAELMHEHGGYCFVDFACSAPYVDVNMNPENEKQRLDAIYFSPHKFLGGPGSCGVLIFNEELYTNKIPDHPGGGTVLWTNPWGEHKYLDAIELREDGGTPPFLQTIKAALAMQLKDKMGTQNIKEREEELIDILWDGLLNIDGVILLAPEVKERLGIFSFMIEDAHYNLVVKILCDKFGVQTRGGCACAGTYGHYLLDINKNVSDSIVSKLDEHCQADKPGWVRMSIHPIMTDEEAYYILESIRDIAVNWKEYEKHYRYDAQKNEYFRIDDDHAAEKLAKSWFS